MGKWQHRLSKIDEAEKTGACSFCGIVKLRKTEKGYRCSIAKVIESRRSRDKRIKLTKPLSKKCDICGCRERLFFDHCHKTGKHRGWLCHLCNILIGMAKDDTKRLRSAIKYLQQNA